MKINAIILTILITSIYSSSYAQIDQTEDLIFDNWKFIYFKKNDGSIDGTRLGRHLGDALRMRYNTLFVFDALEDQPIHVRNSLGQTNIQFSTKGNSWFNSENFGIGTTDPRERLEVNGSILVKRNNLDGINLPYMPNSNLLLIGGNRSGGDAETDFITNRGAGAKGGFEFRDIDNSGTESLLMKINGNGKVGIGTNNPIERLQIGSAIAFHDGGHKVIGFMYAPSGSDLDNSKYAAEVRFDPVMGNLRFGTSSTVVNAPTTRLSIDKNGSVGIGTTDPREKLEVNGSILVEGDNLGGINLPYMPNSRLLLIGRNRSSGDGETDFITNRGGGSKGGFEFRDIDNSGTESLLMKINGDGNVGIGTTNPDSWKLAVNGGIRAKEIKVETGWSDFVFYDNYELPTLIEVEKHIKEKGHLKDIPSANEVQKNGILLGEMNSKLLQKIEELTLYLIEVNKRVGQLEQENTKIKAQIKN